ncbi:hypothetical protein WR25_23380 [Diploscapter pachys]|uniref:Uncharacterized protein n=1 Tax=Diploscapter pachys TaxID=2018661 RepID=A0A2A2KC95_9BILA|nr:hypothetical protein WR25_23380 [Diploscapter pachys]
MMKSIFFILSVLISKVLCRNLGLPKEHQNIFSQGLDPIEKKFESVTDEQLAGIQKVIDLACDVSLPINERHDRLANLATLVGLDEESKKNFQVEFGRLADFCDFMHHDVIPSSSPEVQKTLRHFLGLLKDVKKFVRMSSNEKVFEILYAIQHLKTKHYVELEQITRKVMTKLKEYKLDHVMQIVSPTSSPQIVFPKDEREQNLEKLEKKYFGKWLLQNRLITRFVSLDLPKLMQVQSEDITVAWGQAPHQLDSQYGKWRLAVFQDVQESVDMNRLYFLYDPQADEQSGTSGTRKGYPGLVLFDVNIRCFAGEISLHAPGTMKFLFALKCPSPQGGSAFVLVTEEQMYGQIRLHVFRLDLAGDGLSVSNCRPLLNSPLTIGGEYICSMREDMPEVVVMANPGLQVWRVDAMAESPQEPVAKFTVPGAELTHFYDGFLSNGNVILLSSSPDGHLDTTRVHVLNLSSPGQLNTHSCTADPQRGSPRPRKQAGIDSITNAILLAGGEIDYGNDNVERLVDYWFLDTRTFQWTQVPAQMAVPLIEPRLTACNSGNIFVWGDFDQPLPGMPSEGTHLRILKVTGIEKAGHPPTYNQAITQPPAYPSLGGGATPYPSGAASPPNYPSYNPNQSNPNYQQPGYGQPAPNTGYPQQSYPTQGGSGYNQPGYNAPPG